jgi:hypothetical protein
MKTAVFLDMTWCNMMDKPKVSEQSAASIFRVDGGRKKFKYKKAETRFVYCLGEPKGGGGGGVAGLQVPQIQNLKNIDSVAPMTSEVSHDLLFSRNQRLKSADV